LTDKGDLCPSHLHRAPAVTATPPSRPTSSNLFTTYRWKNKRRRCSTHDAVYKHCYI